ncbi:MAG: hypothetical protein ABL894_07380 [Hyphomicrobium sp.]
MQAIEVQDHARKLMESLGPRAIAEAAHRASALESEGDKGRAQDWRRIEKALRQMQGPRMT